MNRYYKFTTLVLVLALVSCYKDEPMTEPGQQGATALKRCLRNGDDVKMIVDPERLHKITPQRAELIAVNAASAFSSNANTLTYAVKAVAAVEPILSAAASGVALSSAGTRAASATADTLMYAVNFANEEGFALVSFDDRDGDILMYSENGNFDMSEVMASDDIMKFHVDMVMAYQQDKLDRIREARAAGIEYVGEIKMDTTSVEEFDMPTDLAEDPYEQIATRAGLPGSGLPGGGGSGGPGMPGLPGGRIPNNYSIEGWFGNSSAINAAQEKYGNSRYFGCPTQPPTFDNPPGGVWGDIPEGNCPFPPYCNPPITNLEDYYEFYGATLRSSYELPEKTARGLIPEMQKTSWSEAAPLDKYGFVNRLITYNLDLSGCPLAIAQLMIIHKYPNGFQSDFPYTPNSPVKTISLNMEGLNNQQTNTQLLNSPYADQAAIFVREINERAKRYDGGKEERPSKGPKSYCTKVIRWIIKDFGYNIGGGDVSHDFKTSYNEVHMSLRNKNPVLMIGIHDNGIFDPDHRKEGFVWIIDGYMTKGNDIYILDFKFNEYGIYTEQRESLSISNNKAYMHFNMGLGSAEQYSIWVERGVYSFAGTYYATLRVLLDIEPDKP